VKRVSRTIKQQGRKSQKDQVPERNRNLALVLGCGKRKVQKTSRVGETEGSQLKAGSKKGGGV